MNYYSSNRRDRRGKYFPMPNIIFHLGLNANEIAILAFLMSIENRKTFKCHPSYATIGEACGISVNTVRKYVESLQRRGLIYTEPTKVTTRGGVCPHHVRDEFAHCLKFLHGVSPWGHSKRANDNYALALCNSGCI